LEFDAVAFFDKDVAVGGNFKFNRDPFVGSSVAEPARLSVRVTGKGVVIEARDWSRGD
jgi:hypothetical protein